MAYKRQPTEHVRIERRGDESVRTYSKVLRFTLLRFVLETHLASSTESAIPIVNLTEPDEQDTTKAKKKKKKVEPTVAGRLARVFTRRRAFVLFLSVTCHVMFDSCMLLFLVIINVVMQVGRRSLRRRTRESVSSICPCSLDVSRGSV